MSADKSSVRGALPLVGLVQPFASNMSAAVAAKKAGEAEASGKVGRKGTGYAFILVFAALWAMVFSAQTLAVPPGMELIFDGGPKPVIFSGQIHADHGLTCKDCHTGIFKKEKGDAKIAFADHLAGKQYCFACHNGAKAFAAKGNCNKCHGNKSPSAAPSEPPAKAEAPPPATAMKAEAAATPAVAPVVALEATKAPSAAKKEEAAAKPAAAPGVAQGGTKAPTPAKKEEAKRPVTKACEDCPDYSGWSGWAEGGVDYLSNDSYHFGRYTGLEKSGGLVNAGGAVRYRGGDGIYLDGKATDLGLASRDVTVDGGNQGKYGIAVEYDQIPNFRAQDARSPFIDQGGGQLGLPAGWVPGLTTSAMPSLGTDLNSTPLKTERDRLGVKFSMVPGKEWEITGFFRQEKKDGTKDVGATFGFSSTSILPVPFNYKTDDFGLTLGYRGSRLQYSLAYAGSLFRNDQDAITWSNPFSLPSGVDSGRIAEAPDNQSHQVSGHLGYQLTDYTRLGAQLAFGRLTQNQGFQPYTINSSIVTPALPASSLDGLVDTTLAKLDINSRPLPRLRWDASYTYSNRDNKTPVNTYNYVITDTALAIDPNTGSPVIRQNRPYSFRQQLLRTKIGYLMPKDIDLSGGFDYDQMNRTYQQVAETKDKTVWAKVKLHPLETVEGSLKYSYSTRDASAYVPLASQNPLLENPVFPNSVNPLMQAFELADRTRNKLGLEVALTPRQNLSLGLGLDYYKDDYHNMVLGLTQATGLTVTPNVTYVFNERLSASAYYTYEKLSSDQTGNEWIPLPPVSTIWMESDSNLTQTVGLNANWKAIPKKLDVGADVAYSKFTGTIHYAGATDLPDLSSTLTSFGVHGNYKLKENLSLRTALWYEKYQESDWAKTASVSYLPTVLSLGTANQNPDTVLVSVSVRYDFK
ncbi:MAG: MtrB/PioB family decaheme-associated outer membrane protein [Thiobacillaceae bacterium]